MSDRLDREFRHVLRRSPKLSDAEFRLLGFIASYAHGCLLGYEDICKLTNWSRAKLNRTVKSLQGYGLIEIKHGLYKKTKIKIAPAAVQVEFAKAHDVSPMTLINSVTHDSMMCHNQAYDVSPMTQPILERELERKLESAILKENKKENGDNLKPKPGESWNDVFQNLIKSKRMI